MTVATGGWPQAVDLDELRLRRARSGDLAEYCERVYADPAVMRTLPGGQPVLGEAALARARGPLIDHWDAHGFGPWLVTDAQSGRIHGHGGVRFWPDSTDVEVLYALEPAVWGRGVASRVAAMAVETAFERLDVPRLIGAVVPGNDASARVLGKAGFTRTGIRRFGDLSVLMFSLERHVAST